MTLRLCRLGTTVLFHILPRDADRSQKGLCINTVQRHEWFSSRLSLVSPLRRPRRGYRRTPALPPGPSLSVTSSDSRSPHPPRICPTRSTVPTRRPAAKILPRAPQQ